MTDFAQMAKAQITPKRLQIYGINEERAEQIIALRDILFDRNEFSTSGLPVLKASCPADMWFFVSTLAFIPEQFSIQTLADLFGVSKPSVNNWLKTIRTSAGARIEWSGRNKETLDGLVSRGVISNPVPQFVVYSTGVYDSMLFLPFKPLVLEALERMNP